MPTHTPPHKSPGADPGPEHRLAMCRLAVAEAPGVSVCALEIERGGPSYTVDSLEAIHTIAPRAELTFIVGADTARTLASWRKPRRLLELAHMAVAARSGSREREVLDTVAGVLGESPAGAATADRVRMLEMGPVEASSSMVRHALAAGEPVEGLVGPGVAAYIAAHGLYPPGAEAIA